MTSSQERAEAAIKRLAGDAWLLASLYAEDDKRSEDLVRQTEKDALAAVQELATRSRRPEHLPSLPWTWTGGYPQRITGPDATLIAEVFESPDIAAVIAPTICKTVNAYFGVDAEATYPERIEP